MVAAWLLGIGYAPSRPPSMDAFERPGVASDETRLAGGMLGLNDLPVGWLQDTAVLERLLDLDEPQLGCGKGTLLRLDRGYRTDANYPEAFSETIIRCKPGDGLQSYEAMRNSPLLSYVSSPSVAVAAAIMQLRDEGASPVFFGLVRFSDTILVIHTREMPFSEVDAVVAHAARRLNAHGARDLP
jgi:hypothetical protein